MHVAESKDARLSWMLFAALTGVFPSEAELRDFHGQLVAYEKIGTAYNALLSILPPMFAARRPARRMAFIQNKVVADVDFTSRNDYTTGIQRVTRSIISEWSQNREFELLGWNKTGNYLVQLNEDEMTRMQGAEFPPPASFGSRTMVVPADCAYFLPEVPRQKVSIALSGLAASGVSRITCIGYDMIPVTSAPRLSHTETQKFASYLYALKHFHKVIAISHSSSTEFRSFNKMISAHGAQGPLVLERRLPMSRVNRDNTVAPAPINEVKRIVCVGTIEPRKGQRKVLAACESLWNRGYQFEMDFVGHADPVLSGAFLADFAKSQNKARPVKLWSNATDEDLSDLYERADFSVFVSEHEGFGLPIAESLAHGTPVVASNFGIMKELASRGDCVLVNPREIESIAAGIENMLLREQGQFGSAEDTGFAAETWKGFADDIWEQIVE